MANITAFPLLLTINGDGSSLTATVLLASAPTSVSVVNAFASNGSDVSGNIASVVPSGSSIVFTFNTAFTGTISVEVSLTNATYASLPLQPVQQITSPWVVSLASTTITGSVAVTNAGTFAVQDAAAEASLATIVGTISAGKVAVSGTIAATQSGAWSISVSNFPATQPVSGTITANQGTPGSLANAWPHELTDGTHGPVAVKAASTAAVAADSALVVAISPNNSVAVTGTFFQATQPVSGTIAATQSGTWNIGTVTAVTAITNALPTGANTIGKVDVLGNAGATLDAAINGAAPTNVIWNSQAPTTVVAGACVPLTINGLATSVVKASPGNVYGFSMNNTSSTPVYLQFYNQTTTPTLGTGVVFCVACSIGITFIPISSIAMANFSVGIGIGASTNPTTAAVPSVAPVVTVFYK